MKEYSLEEFIRVLASKEPVPGGGGASALVGSVGTALASMVASLTTGKAKYAMFQADMDRILPEAKRLQERLLDLMEEDAVAFEPLSRAYSLPKDTPEEQAYRQSIMEEALVTASLTPLRIMETSLEAMALQEELLEKGSVLALSDVGVGVKMLDAALQGASLNVFINTGMMQDRGRAGEFNERAEALIAAGSEKAERIFREVRARI